jgi:hypothetical protein
MPRIEHEADVAGPDFGRVRNIVSAVVDLILPISTNLRRLTHGCDTEVADTRVG